MYAIKDALSLDPNKRLGATWESFTHHEFFSCIDFLALERKEIEPVFVPSSEKTNFDATYDLEELLLEEAPLEARARRQKPRERLKDDATDKEIREDELYRMIDTDFRPFDYTVAAYKKYDRPSPPPCNPNANLTTQTHTTTRGPRKASRKLQTPTSLRNRRTLLLADHQRRPPRQATPPRRPRRRRIRLGTRSHPPPRRRPGPRAPSPPPLPAILHPQHKHRRLPHRPRRRPAGHDRREPDGRRAGDAGRGQQLE